VPAFVYINEVSKDVFEQRSAPWVTAGLMSACDYILSKLWWTGERECARELMVCLMVEMLRTEFYKIPTAVEVFSQPVGVFPQLVGFSGIAITNPDSEYARLCTKRGTMTTP
jgi:hypothetical protein